MSEFENLLCGSPRISAFSVFKLPLTQRTQRTQRKLFEFKTPHEKEKDGRRFFPSI
jgi:hypothetical protein